jgi:electron transport complex protein RnfD
MTDEYVEPILKKQAFVSVDELYAAVGYGSMTAEKVVRRLLGGIVSPVCAALAPWFFLGDHMTIHTALFEKLDIMKASYVDEIDELAAETVLDVIKAGTLPEPSLLEHFLGQSPDSIGAMSAILLLLGLCYLLARKVVSWHTPVAFVVVATLVWFLTRFDGINYWFIVYELCAGGVILGAFFAATEYTATPVTNMGRILYGALCGGLLMLFRYLGYFESSTVLAILAASILTRPIDMITGELIFGCTSKNIGGRLITLIPTFKKK